MTNYKITVAYDEQPAHATFTYADEYSTVNLYTPSGKCYTKLFYREGRRVVVK